jgi:hypothetical protein
MVKFCGYEPEKNKQISQFHVVNLLEEDRFWSSNQVLSGRGEEGGGGEQGGEMTQIMFTHVNKWIIKFFKK